MAELKISEREDGDVTILDFAGSIRREGGMALRETVHRLLNENKKMMLLNFAEVSDIDPIAIGELLSSYSAISKAGGELRLLHLTEKIQDLLVVTKLLTVFDVFETEQEAITSFTPNAVESLDRLPTFDYLEDFFPISNELTQKIVEANSQLILNEEKTIADEDRDELDAETDEDYSEQQSVDFESIVLAEYNSERDWDVEVCQQTIRERLYRFLAFLARSQRAKRGEPYEIFEVLPQGLETLLGLQETSGRFGNLTIALTNEFRNWLRQHDNHYKAGWGEMGLEDDNLLRLKANEARNREPSRKYSPAVYFVGMPHANRKR